MSSKSSINSFSNPIIRPTNIAIFISLVVHLVLLIYAFPRLVIQEKKKTNIRENVATIELTPEEQSRLPNLTPELDIPELNPTPFSDNLPFALSPSRTRSGRERERRLVGLSEPARRQVAVRCASGRRSWFRDRSRVHRGIGTISQNRRRNRYLPAGRRHAGRTFPSFLHRKP